MFYNLKKVVLFLKLATLLILVRNYGKNYLGIKYLKLQMLPAAPLNFLVK